MHDVEVHLQERSRSTAVAGVVMLISRLREEGGY